MEDGDYYPVSLGAEQPEIHMGRAKKRKRKETSSGSAAEAFKILLNSSSVNSHSDVYFFFQSYSMALAGALEFMDDRS